MADTLALGASGVKPVEVQVLSPAPSKNSHVSDYFLISNLTSNNYIFAIIIL